MSLSDEANSVDEIAASTEALAAAARLGSPTQFFLVSKRILDVLAALLALPFVALVALGLLLINPSWNAGPLIFAQTRMGRGCVPFRAFKFRTMRPANQVSRGPDDPLETDRITRLGQFLRRMRIDELPQFINVLLGEMSLVGPRPDYWEHALHYAATIPGYRMRYSVRPGITGFAQVASGYAEGADQTVAKTRYDLRYIADAGWRMDADILWRTVRVILTGFGAR
ncbi:MAG: sugar transferase [Paracoccaceae bacterium]